MSSSEGVAIKSLEIQIDPRLRLKLAPPARLQVIFDCRDELGRILRGLRKSLDNKLAAITH
jgi:hypothetical protein